MPVSPGEIIDKLTILTLKRRHIHDPGKLANVAHEQAALQAIVDAKIPSDPRLAALWDDLLTINAALWTIEDDIRICERNGDFGPEFVRLARAVYVTNDRRAEVKKAINLHLGSTIIEEKSYQDHGGADAELG